MRDAVRAGKPREAVEAEAGQRLAAAGFASTTPSSARPDLTDPGDGETGPRVALIAARLGRTRLIDNLEFTA